MLLSRFWYFVLAAACGIAFAAALLTQAAFNRQYDTDLNDQLRRDRLELDLMMRTHARSRIDAIAPIAAHPDVRSGLSRANRRGERMTVPSDIRSPLEDKLRSLNRQLEAMSGDLLFAVDDQGYIIAQLGASDPPPGAGLGNFPLVERALAGYVRDDSWIYNGKVYGMAARPVIDSGQYVGAIVHGLELDEDLARKLGEPLNKATVAFFWNDRVLASYMPDGNAARADDVEGALAQASQDEDFAAGRRSTPLDLEGGSRAIYQRLTGSAGQAGVGFSVARPRHTLASVWDVFDLITLDDVNALPPSVLGGLIGGSLLLFLLGMFWLWVERDRPFGRLKHASASLAKREVDRLTITDFGGGYRKIAQNVNDAMDKAVESAAAASPKRKAADLDEILGPTPGGGASSPQFFGFAGNPDAEADEDFPDDIPAIPPAGGRGGPPPKPAGGPPPKPAGAPPPPSSALGAPPPAAPKPPPPASPAAKAPPPPAPKVPPHAGGAAAGGPGLAGAAPATPGVDDKPDWQKGTLLGVGSAESEGGSGPMQAPPAAKPGIPPPPEDGFADDEDGVTMVAEVPKELLNQAASQAKGGGDADEQHFREVFDKFVATKKDCGEPTAGLTFDKFVQTLRKNRDQIVQRHGAKTVRFTVYQKDGKAALKATPVKD